MHQTLCDFRVQVHRLVSKGAVPTSYLDLFDAWVERRPNELQSIIKAAGAFRGRPSARLAGVLTVLVDRFIKNAPVDVLIIEDLDIQAIRHAMGEAN